MSTDKRRPSAVMRTLDVVLAAATAEHDLRQLAESTERRFEFRLLAAAAHESPELPAEGWRDLQRALRVQATASGGELRLSIQAEGFAALQRVLGRAGRLTSHNGALNLRFRFDAAGNAFAALAASPAVYQALTHFHLILDEPDGA